MIILKMLVNQKILQKLIKLGKNFRFAKNKVFFIKNNPIGPKSQYKPNKIIYAN